MKKLLIALVLLLLLGLYQTYTPKDNKKIFSPLPHKYQLEFNPFPNLETLTLTDGQKAERH